MGHIIAKAALDAIIASCDLRVDLSRQQFQAPSDPSTRDLSSKAEARAEAEEVTKAVGYCRAVDDGIEER